ncbi:3-methyl-2-oxobutanoate hydroxymethyltransferase [Glaciecola punicea ACAM 611]|uniref:3-methyl-2-oxobutanoate hydroxymethyltransferase n=1 Tax=Glaciecola punicea ACAM 611 TaxID=1121923 RepID=H5TEW2_9ALTE|nr:3-methyl-2-oxobutanoate hydroxymethyltransferase [Glaciecola punicea]GAB56889.1 3-methyl-2-oxobutanoate hydroxymethyltransferase [Glaciecola punicea ACAM 611]
MKKHNVTSLLKMKQAHEKIVALTAYDASFAQLFDQQNVEVILIGDSLGMVLKGQEDTLSVSVKDIAYHTRCVRAGAKKAFVIADMPFMSYPDANSAYKNAATLIRSGASMVKLEGGEWLLNTVAGLVERSVPVCGHLGLTPQSVHVLGGFKVQGREQNQAEKLINEALALEAAGIQLLVLECVPSSLAKLISEKLTIPVIGIGAGPHTDGQILVMHDMLGVSANYMPKFSKNYLNATGSISGSVKQYISEVKSQTFPGPEHSFD